MRVIAAIACAVFGLWVSATNAQPSEGGAMPEWTGAGLGGDIRDAPSCVSWTGAVHCFARGGDETLKHVYWAGGAWRAWESLGGQLRESPVCVSGRENKIDCFVRGTDGALWRQSWDGSKWQGWVSAGGSLYGPPSCVAWGADTDCFSVGKD